MVCPFHANHKILVVLRKRCNEKFVHVRILILDIFTSHNGVSFQFSITRGDIRNFTKKTQNKYKMSTSRHNEL